MQLTKNFSLKEFEASATAAAKGIDNTAPCEARVRLASLCTGLLQPLRNYAQRKRKDKTYFEVSSGYRSDELNAFVGGASTSQHRKGEAADIKAFQINDTRSKQYIEPIEIATALIESGIPFDQCILYNTFVHLSYVAYKDNRRQVLYNAGYAGPKL